MISENQPDNQKDSDQGVSKKRQNYACAHSSDA